MMVCLTFRLPVEVAMAEPLEGLWRDKAVGVEAEAGAKTGAGAGTGAETGTIAGAGMAIDVGDAVAAGGSKKRDIDGAIKTH